MIYAMVVDDRHSEPQVTLFLKEERALKRAKTLAQESASEPDDFEEQDLNDSMIQDGWIYYATYSVEGDCVWVMKRNIVGDIKPFSEVEEGDEGKDHGDCVGTVIAKGTLSELKRYDSTGACDDESLLPNTDEMVAVRTDDGETLLYAYGDGGFTVEVTE